MLERSIDRATDCRTRSTDWTSIGARILQAAAAASAIHLMENAEAQSGPTPGDAHGPSTGGGEETTDVWVPNR